MKSIFTPSSVAVIGASSNLERISGLPIKYLQEHEYDGKIYPINPNHDEVGGLKCYSNVSDLPETPDLSMVIIPASYVLEAVKESLELGIETVLIVSSGFSETGTESGTDAEHRLSELASKYDANIIGPNSQGIISVQNSATASFTPALQRDSLLEGDVSFVTQSGAFGGALTTILQESGVGLNRWVATGNEADLESLDFVQSFANDELTGVAAGYIEGFVDGRKLIELKRTSEGIELPIVVLKVGRSDRGKTAAASHTGKIAGSARVYDGVFAETGVMAVNDIDRFVDVVSSISMLDELPGRRLAVMTTSGGAGVHIADVATNEGLFLPELTGKTRERIEKHLPAYGSAVNPVDITAQVVNDPDVFEQCLQLLLSSDIDTVLLQITNASGEQAAEYADIVTDAADDFETPLFVSWTGGLEKDKGKKTYHDANIPVFENPRAAVETIASINRFKQAKPRLRESADLPARPPVQSNDGPALVTETEGKELLSEYGISVPSEHLASDANEAAEAADRIGYPVVAKLVSPDIQHRNSISGIRTDLNSAQDVSDAFREIETLCNEQGASLTGVSVQQQIPSGTELSVGIIIDDIFGPMLMFGRGGVDIESNADVTFRTIPTAEPQASAMIDEVQAINTSSLSDDQSEAIVDVLVSMSALYEDNTWIREADVNPLIVSADDVTAVDALFLGPESDS